MKKMLLFIMAFVVIISSFFACEIVMTSKHISMPTMMKYFFGVSFLLLSLSTITYITYSKISKRPPPDFISTNIIEIVALSIAVFFMSVILLLKK